LKRRAGIWAVYLGMDIERSTTHTEKRLRSSNPARYWPTRVAPRSGGLRFALGEAWIASRGDCAAALGALLRHTDGVSAGGAEAADLSPEFADQDRNAPSRPKTHTPQNRVCEEARPHEPRDRHLAGRAGEQAASGPNAAWHRQIRRPGARDRRGHNKHNGTRGPTGFAPEHLPELHGIESGHPTANERICAAEIRLHENEGAICVGTIMLEVDLVIPHPFQRRSRAFGVRSLARVRPPCHSCASRGHNKVCSEPEGERGCHAAECGIHGMPPNLTADFPHSGHTLVVLPVRS
jgi:hypothetical protein